VLTSIRILQNSLDCNFDQSHVRSLSYLTISRIISNLSERERLCEKSDAATERSCRLENAMGPLSNADILRKLYHTREFFYARHLNSLQAKSPLVVSSTLPIAYDTLTDVPQIWDCSNKTVPIYYARRHIDTRHFSKILLTAYGVWRDSPQISTEFQRFLSKTFVYGRGSEREVKEPVPIQSRPLDRQNFTVEDVMRSHKELCEHFVALHDQILGEIASGTFEKWKYIHIDTRNPQAYRLKRLFCVLAIIILDDLTTESIDTSQSVQMLPVKLVWTGSNEGIEASIDLSEVSPTITIEAGGFQAVTTTLLAALKFISALEQRQLEFDESRGYELGSDMVELPEWGSLGDPPPEEYLKVCGIEY
jgi:hypothetical protein